jgi:hypothetical protein
MMELMPESLATHIDKRNGTPFPFHVAIDIMVQLAKAQELSPHKKPQKIRLSTGTSSLQTFL